MKHLLFPFLLFPFLLNSQTEKSVKPIQAPAAVKTGATYAVVIGISDYQDPDIPDLQFADRDAEAFAQWLRSPAIGLDADHLKLLTNQQATTGQCVESLDWLIEQSKEGDNCILYFSGHGDIETKTMRQAGYLLTSNSPSKTYIAGALPLSYLQDVIETLSLKNKVKITVITDACHAGKLAGSQFGGPQTTAASLRKGFANEIEILSCQPDEYSQEGAQWGGGRGVFSYYLVDGFYGLADKDGDFSVSLFEIQRYLEDNVTREAPSQIPVVVGNKTVRMAKVAPEILANLQRYKDGQILQFNIAAQKGLEEKVLARLNPNTKAQYAAFKNALKAKQYFEPAGTCAEDLYAILSSEPKLKPLHGFLKRNYAAALQDDAQQVLNAWLHLDMDEISQSRNTRLKRYASFPRALGRAAALLGKEHYAYNDLMARKLLFEGFLTYLQNPENFDSRTGRLALEKYQQAIQYQPDLPHIYLFMSYALNFNLHEPDSAKTMAMKAALLAPKWTLPYTATAKSFMLLFPQKKMQEAIDLLNQAKAIDSTGATYLNVTGLYYLFNGKFQEGEYYFTQSLKVDSNYVSAWGNLAAAYGEQGRNEEAEQAIYKALRIDSTYAFVYHSLGIIYMRTGKIAEALKAFQTGLQNNETNVYLYITLGYLLNYSGRFSEAAETVQKGLRYDSVGIWMLLQLGNAQIGLKQYDAAEKTFKKAIDQDSTKDILYLNLGRVYALSGRPEAAFKAMLKTLEINPDNGEGYYNLACLSASKTPLTQAFNYLEQAFQKGYLDFEATQKDPDLAPLREQPEPWKGLMKKYFPDQIKD